MIDSVARPFTLGRINRLDIALTLFVSMFGVYVMWLMASGSVIDGEVMDASYAALPLILLVTAPLLLRSQAPLQGLALSIAGLAIHAALIGSTFRCGPVYLVAFVLAYSAAFRLPRRGALLGLVLAIGLCMLTAAAGDGMTGIILQPAVLLLWGAGRFARSRARLNDELEAHTSALRTARDDRARLEVATDRARLSTELDELLKRRLSDLAHLADAGSAQSDPAAATGTLVEIERGSRQTLEDMREIVGVLRSDRGGPAVAPLPTLAHLDAMLLRAKGAGAHLRVIGDPRALPAGVELSAYRVVEHLLDALDDAHDVDVEISFSESTLGLSVSGRMRRRDLGPALERARERVQLHRGTLSTTVRGGRAEAIAHLPVGATA